ncbi:inverse autotransporter beta domain-containing protein, partial [Yersinia ruckeri]|uniref:inverse autotransporter beta domain-containing protein n=3 Tax=Yersinia ruckeri TaxID=29486 RepID=UPI002237128F
MAKTLIGLQSVIDGHVTTANQPSSPLLAKEKQTVTSENHEITVSSQAEPTPNLPSLGSDSISSGVETEPSTDLAGSAMQAGRILSSDNVTNTSIGYAKSIGEGLINQQINDWLSQKGTTRFSVGFDQKISGDLLLPLMGRTDSLFFTQFGLHSNEDRNTLNVGMGYRQYIDDWMYGINTFYDYDYTGKNVRLGVGGEAWTDYLKLAVNGYYGQTDWHQSQQSVMKDYDERPANGFDLRAEAYLPSYPQLGANLKYEQYFGTGIVLNAGTDPDDLKDNPKALTFGLNYTPIPLITLKGEHSVGDKNDNRIGLDVNYRFGVPWARQVSADSVDSLRSLMGSMYEFVDRNYDVVMQYRKQDLLRISLPNVVTAKAAETLILPLTVVKAKYGLKDVQWTASAEFFANGGSFRELSLTQLEVTLPPYVYTKNTNAVQEYVIKAIGVDNNGNNSNTAATTIKVEPSKNIISDLTIMPAGSVTANDIDYFTVTALVLDEQNHPMTGQPIKFDIDNMKSKDGYSAATLFKDGKTDAQTLTIITDNKGRATVYVRSKLAKEGIITATMNNGNYKSGRVDFIADVTTAKIATLTTDKAVAVDDGKAAITFTATVKDAGGNLAPNTKVQFTTTEGALSKTEATTDEHGVATVTLTSRVAGKVDVSAKTAVDTEGKTTSVTFTADVTTAKIATLTTDKAVAVDDGKAAITFTATVKDAGGNLAPNTKVQFTTTEGALSKTEATTDEHGVATVTLTSRVAGKVDVSAKTAVDTEGKTTSVTFTADVTTAKIATLTTDKAVAVDDGKAAITFTATVKDAGG